MFNIPYLYHYVNRQDLSVSRSRQVARANYALSRSGLPGNSDAGAMETWLLWNMVGLYPITGQTTFLIHSPWFESMTIDLGSGKQLNISASSSSSSSTDDEDDIYVQSLKVNGQQWRKNWLTWEDVFVDGGSLEFELGSQAVNWTDSDAELPPSPASSS